MTKNRAKATPPSLSRQFDHVFSLPDRIIKGDFGAAFSGGGSVEFVVVDDAVFTVIYHFAVALDVGGSACTEELFGIIGVVVGFE